MSRKLTLSCGARPGRKSSSATHWSWEADDGLIIDWHLIREQAKPIATKSGRVWRGSRRPSARASGASSPTGLRQQKQRRKPRLRRNQERHLPKKSTRNERRFQKPEFAAWQKRRAQTESRIAIFKREFRPAPAQQRVRPRRTHGHLGRLRPRPLDDRPSPPRQSHSGRSPSGLRSTSPLILSVELSPLPPNPNLKKSSTGPSRHRKSSARGFVVPKSCRSSRKIADGTGSN